VVSRFVSLVLGVALLAACGDSRSSKLTAPGEPIDWSSVEHGWSQLEPPPLVRARAASVWTGTQLFFWGGDSGYGGTFHSDGALYDPSSGKWRMLPPAPITVELGSAAVWTGRETLVWSGTSEGAAFDPEADSWRELPKSPVSFGAVVANVWTGKEAILWGNASRAVHASALDGAAYDPSTDTWRTLPPAPFALNQAAAVWTGNELIVYGALLDGNNWSETKHARGLAYDPAKDTWRVLAPFPLSPQASEVVWTGEEMLAWDYELHAGAYDPESDTWRKLPDLPLGFSECYPQGAAVGRFVLAYHCGSAALFDTEAEAWSIVPGRLEIYGRPVSVGPVVLFAGAAHEGHANALWAYKPGPEGVSDFVPRTEQRGRRTLMPLTFPDGTSIVLSYPEWLRLAELGVQPDVSYLRREDPPPRFPLVFYYGDVSERAGPVVAEPGSWFITAPGRDREVELLRSTLRARETADGLVALDPLPPLALAREFGEGGGPQLALGDLDPDPQRVSSLDPMIVLRPSDCGLPGPEISNSHGAKCLGDVYVGVYGDRPFIEAVLAGLRLERG
jgi:hypothetical protein